MSLAANYVVATSPISLQLRYNDIDNIYDDSVDNIDDSCQHSTANVNAKTNANNEPIDNTCNKTLPFVIIIDPEHAMDIHSLYNYVQSATLRKWNRTQQFRTYFKQEQQRRRRKSCTDPTTDTTNTTEMDHTQKNEMNENVLIDQDISHSLKRIHIIHPKDFANGYVATLECIKEAIITYELEYMKKEE